MEHGAGVGGSTHMDVQAGERARREFRRSHRGRFTTWGVVLLIAVAAGGAFAGPVGSGRSAPWREAWRFG
jgi:hypothetical protein